MNFKQTMFLKTTKKIVTFEISVDVNQKHCFKGYPEPKVELYKDGTLPRFCNGDGLFHDSDFVTLEVLHSSLSDTGCYELHLTNELGTDVSLVNVKVKENSREGSVVWQEPLER